MGGNRVWLETVDRAVVVRKQFVAPTVDANGVVHHPATRHELETRWLNATERLPTVNLLESDPSSLLLTTEFATGRTLAHPSLTATQIVDGLVSACEALHQLHQQGITHGAVRPEHVLVGSGRVWLCGATGQRANPSYDAIGFNLMLKDLMWLQFSLPSERSESAGWRQGKQRRKTRKRHEQWGSALTVMNQDFSRRLPNPRQLMQLFGGTDFQQVNLSRRG